MCQQEEEQSLGNVLGGNVDKMQLTRRILDLKQVSVIKERAKELLIINRETIHMLNHILEINLYTFPHVNGLYCIFFRRYRVIYLWLTVICLPGGCMVKTGEVIVGLCSPVSMQDELLYRNLHEEINHLALKLEKQGKTDGKNISTRRKHINKMYTLSLDLNWHTA